MLRLLIWPLLAFAAVLIPGPIRAEPAPARIVAVGDIHGDHDAWLAIVRAAGLIDAKGRWAGGQTVLVQLGDVVDRGPDSLDTIHHLMKLQREAPRKGGRVIVLVGNHEAMNMIGDLRYVHPGEYKAYADRDSKARRDRVYEANREKIEVAYRARDPAMSPDAIRAAWMKATPLGMLEHQAAWLPDGEIGKWVIANPAMVKLGDTLFVHGGVSEIYAALTIEQINRRVADALKMRDQRPTAIINDPVGPLWYRGMIIRGDDDEATRAPIPPGKTVALGINDEISLVLQSYGVKRIVVGHTPSLQGIIAASNGRLWRADSAISRAYGGMPSYLEIVGDKVTAHNVPRPAGAAWGSQR
jgi:hypothetical protein